MPNAGRKLVTLPKKLEWNKLFKKHIKELDDKKPVIICGDMNVAHQEIGRASVLYSFNFNFLNFLKYQLVDVNNRNINLI